MVERGNLPAARRQPDARRRLRQRELLEHRVVHREPRDARSIHQEWIASEAARKAGEPTIVSITPASAAASPASCEARARERPSAVASARSSTVADALCRTAWCSRTTSRPVAVSMTIAHAAIAPMTAIGPRRLPCATFPYAHAIINKTRPVRPMGVAIRRRSSDGESRNASAAAVTAARPAAASSGAAIRTQASSAMIATDT